MKGHLTSKKLSIAELFILTQNAFTSADEKRPFRLEKSGAFQRLRHYVRLICRHNMLNAACARHERA